MAVGAWGMAATSTQLARTTPTPPELRRPRSIVLHYDAAHLDPSQPELRSSAWVTISTTTAHCHRA